MNSRNIINLQWHNLLPLTVKTQRCICSNRCIWYENHFICKFVFPVHTLCGLYNVLKNGVMENTCRKIYLSSHWYMDIISHIILDSFYHVHSYQITENITVNWRSKWNISVKEFTLQGSNSGTNIDIGCNSLFLFLWQISSRGGNAITPATSKLDVYPLRVVYHFTLISLVELTYWMVLLERKHPNEWPITNNKCHIIPFIPQFYNGFVRRRRYQVPGRV